MHEQLGAVLAAVNAGLNSTSGLLLFVGFLAIRRRNVALHRRCMLAAMAVSALFLACYLTRVYLTRTHRYPGTGLLRGIYLFFLFTHMVFAAVTPPLAVRALWLAWKQRFDEHRRLVRWAWPIWMYTSVTGVIVYFMLYHGPR